MRAGALKSDYSSSGDAGSMAKMASARVSMSRVTLRWATVTFCLRYQYAPMQDRLIRYESIASRSAICPMTRGLRSGTNPSESRHEAEAVSGTANSRAQPAQSAELVCSEELIVANPSRCWRESPGIVVTH